MNFYRISNFSAKITKKSLKILFICVTGFADSPLELLFLLTRGPWPMGKNRAGFGRPLPAPRLTGGEVWVGGNEEEAETNPKVVFLGLGVVGLGVPRGEVRRRLG